MHAQGQGRAGARRTVAVVAAVIGLAAASTTAVGAAPVRPAARLATDRAEAVLRDAGGVDRGRVTLVQEGDRVLVHVRATGLSAGFHGLHVHATGTCVAPFTSAGPHLGAPATVVPANAGDLPPLIVGADGQGAATFAVSRFSVASLFDADGAAVVVHAGADNFANIPARYGVVPDAQTLATGDAGARVLCGVVAPGGEPAPAGYWALDRRGGLFAFGSAPFHGSRGGVASADAFVGMAATPGGTGYWLASADGGVFAFGAAGFAGSAAALRLRSPVVGIAAPGADATATVRDATGAVLGTVAFAQEAGRVRVTADVHGLTPGFHGFHLHTTGRCVAPFTSAGGHLGVSGAVVPGFAGDMVSLLADPDGVARAAFVTDRFRVDELVDGDGAAVVVHAGADNFANIPARYGVVPDAQTLATGDAGGRVGCGEVALVGGTTGAGYWLVGADGGVFAFGDAPFLGGMGGTALAEPVVGMAATPTGAGYWLVGADGGVFAFGDAPFLGGMGGTALAEPVVGMAATPTGAGYWLVGADGGVFAFGDAAHAGPGPAASTGIAGAPDGLGYWVVGADGAVAHRGDAAFAGARAGSPGAAFVCILGASALL